MSVTITTKPINFSPLPNKYANARKVVRFWPVTNLSGSAGSEFQEFNSAAHMLSLFLFVSVFVVLFLCIVFIVVALPLATRSYFLSFPVCNASNPVQRKKEKKVRNYFF